MALTCVSRVRDLCDPCEGCWHFREVSVCKMSDPRHAPPICLNPHLPFPAPFVYHTSRRQNRGRNSVVECSLPKADVVGSNPIARS